MITMARTIEPSHLIRTDARPAVFSERHTKQERDPRRAEQPATSQGQTASGTPVGTIRERPLVSN
jgi:hypothetical protein